MRTPYVFLKRTLQERKYSSIVVLRWHVSRHITRKDQHKRTLREKHTLCHLLGTLQGLLRAQRAMPSCWQRPANQLLIQRSVSMIVPALAATVLRVRAPNT